MLTGHTPEIRTVSRKLSFEPTLEADVFDFTVVVKLLYPHDDVEDVSVSIAKKCDVFWGSGIAVKGFEASCDFCKAFHNHTQAPRLIPDANVKAYRMPIPFRP